MLFVFFAVPTFTLAMGSAVTLMDDLGNKVVLSAPAKRIVSLAPSVTEIVYAAGAGSRLVGASAYSDWPPAARKLPHVGDAFRIDLERIAALKPDLVIAWASATPPAARDALRRLGLPLVLFAPRKLSEIADEIQLVGKAAGTQTAAGRAAQAFLRERERLARAYAGRKPVSVFYEISANPLYTVGGRQFISQVLTLCGGRNIFSDLGELAPVVSRAAVLARNPQAILTGSDVRTSVRLAAWKRWPWLVAVKSGNLFTVPGEMLGRASPRILEAAVVVCRDLDTARRRLKR
ncbi:MAG: cobalamin-binding protein [Gammaproteobacteria bacterium]